MFKRLLLALVGMAMGGFAGLFIALMGAGNLAIIGGAVIGAFVFAFGVPRLSGAN